MTQSSLTTRSCTAPLRLRSARRGGVKVLIGLLIGVALAWAQL